jgi:hypothetical protein
MNTLQDLNSFSSASIEFTDNRPAGVTFDRTTPTNGEVTTTQNTTHSVPVGIQILEVINYSSAAVTYTINVSAAAGATVTWPTVPSGCTVTNPSTGVYTISGVKSKAIWDIVRSPTVLSPTGINNDFWQYTATITYNSTVTKSWYVGVYVGTVTVLTTPSNSTYTSGSTTSITGEPQIQYPGSAPTWTVTVTPELTDAVTTLSSAGSGGTSTFNSTTKVLTIVGTKTEVNSHLSTVSVQSVANNHWTYNLTYVATNATDIATATKTQQLNSTSTTVLFETVSDEIYSVTETYIVSNGPQINDSAASGLGSYTSTVYAIPTTAISLIDSDGGFQTIFNSDESQKIVPSTISSNDSLADLPGSIAMTSNGNVLAISTRLKDVGAATDAGAVYIYTRTSIYSSTWTYRAKLDAGANAATNDYFGWYIAISDGTTSPITLAIGSPYDDNSGGTDAGSVYIFTSSDNGITWSQQTRLQASDVAASDTFGSSVSLSSDGSILAVGSPADDTDLGTNCGSVYIFTRSGSTWSQQTKINPASGDASLSGRDISLNSDATMLAISTRYYGGSGSEVGYIWIYTRSGSTWTYQTRFRGSDSLVADDFGIKISLNSDGTYIAVGSYADDNSNGTDKGSVYIFTRSGTTWTEQTRLQATSFTSSTGFGANVKFNSDASVLAIGVPGGTSTGTNTGSVYIFTRSGTTWTQSQVLDASDSDTSEAFGSSLALNSLGNSLAVGCPNETTSPTTLQGAVYMFTKIANPTSLTWDPETLTYTIVGNRYASNAILNNLSVTPGSWTNTTFNLIYTATTPTPATATRNQRVNKA